MPAQIAGDALEGVAATTFWTLRNRAEEALRPDSSFADEWAVRLYREIDGDYERFGKPNQAHPLRARALDAAVSEFLCHRPDATVVALGEGLQSTYWRLGRPAVDWVSVDLDPVIDMREQVLPAEPRVRHVRGSALDLAWAEGIDPAGGVFVSAEGLLMYFEPEQTRSLIVELAARFPGGQLFFDSIPRWFSAKTQRGLTLAKGYTAPRMPFSLTVSQAERLVELPGVATAVDVPLPAGRGLFGVEWLRRLGDRPPLKDVRPSITLLTFEG